MVFISPAHFRSSEKIERQHLTILKRCIVVAKKVMKFFVHKKSLHQQTRRKHGKEPTKFQAKLRCGHS